MRAVSKLLLSLAVLLVIVGAARADGPITAAQCYEINPNPAVTTCSAYAGPAVDLYADLPYDSVAVYTDCVKERCVCSGAANNTDITTSGYYCNSSGWMESGYVTCNTELYCFEKYWQCLNRNAMTRYHESKAEMDAAELALAADIISHGTVVGNPFEETDTYRSCRMIMCEAIDSRQNCGLITCSPNYTQCDEYMLPPPQPYTHQLCTQGCRAVLIMMSFTIIVIALSVTCVCCCPPVVRVSAPVIKTKDDAKSKKTDQDSRTSSRPGPATNTSHTSHHPTEPNGKAGSSTQ